MRFISIVLYLFEHVYIGWKIRYPVDSAIQPSYNRPQEVSHWRVKSSGVSQNKMLKATLPNKGLGKYNTKHIPKKSILFKKVTIWAINKTNKYTVKVRFCIQTEILQYICLSSFWLKSWVLYKMPFFGMCFESVCLAEYKLYSHPSEAQNLMQTGRYTLVKTYFPS